MSFESSLAFEVEWRIENLRSWFVTRDDSLYSPRFLVETLSNTGWKLSLFSSTQKAEKYICLALERDVEDDRPQQVTVSYELSFLASDGSPLKSKNCTSKFAPKSVSQELIVKEVEIFLEKKESYLPEGVLTVCCKLWKAWSSTSRGGSCLLKSAIGQKSILLDGTIDYFNRLNERAMLNVMANFASPHSDISFISFVVANRNTKLNFERVEVKCKRLNMSYFELFILDGMGEKITCFESLNLLSLFRSDESCSFIADMDYLKFRPYMKKCSLTLQLKITYYPGVKAECVEYEVNNYDLIDDSAELENVKCSDSKKVHSSHISKLQTLGCDVPENKLNHEGERFGSTENRNLTLTSLTEDMMSLFKEKLFCDMKLQTDKETFPAHRCVLSARSPVFKKMFTTDMKEKAGECVNVPDISSDTVRRMLQFLYTDCTGDLDMQSAKDLYIASDKYDIASLKQRCSSFMKKNFCPANVCEILVLADMHQDKNLESAAQEYVLINDDEVFYSDEWKCFMKNYGCLAAQVMYLKFTKK